MKQEQPQETKLRQYLLGELNLEEQVLVEQQLFLDGDYSELAQAVQDDLIDEYVHDDLAASEREKFESHFLEQPEHRGDLRIAAALKKYLVSDDAAYPSFATNIETTLARRSARMNSGPHNHEDQRVTFFPLSLRRKPVAWFALAAAVLVITSVVIWIAIHSMQRQQSEQPLQAHDPQPTQTVDPQQPSPGVPLKGNGERRVETAERQGGTARPKGKLTTGSASPPNSFPSGTSLAFTIYPGGVSRSETQNNRVSISSKIETVILRLPVRAIPNYDSYSAILRSRRRMISHWPDLPTEVDIELGKIVKVDVATALLREERYEIILAGIPADSRPAATYTFFVDKK